MCKKLTVAYGDYIGNRMVGWCLFNGKDYGFISDKQVGAKLRQGERVNGLKLDEEGAVTIDREFTRHLLGKSGLTFSPIMAADDAEEEPVMNKYYALVKVVKSKVGNQYHFITNRCGYEVFSEQQVKAMLEILDFGGLRMDEKGAVVIHEGVEVKEATEGQSKAQRDKTEGVA